MQTLDDAKTLCQKAAEKFGLPWATCADVRWLDVPEGTLILSWGETYENPRDLDNWNMVPCVFVFRNLPGMDRFERLAEIRGGFGHVCAAIKKLM